MSCRHIVAAQLRGEDSTAAWRQALADSTTAQYRQRVPSAMPAAFVLQFYLDVLATPAAYAAVLGYVIDVSPPVVSFALAPVRAYPVAVQLRTGELVTDEPDADARRALARDRYVAHAAAFATSYEPATRISSRQRLGMVDDVWDKALETASRALLPPPHPSPHRRQSCCFIYVLPGVHECAMCPRLA